MRVIARSKKYLALVIPSKYVNTLSPAGATCEGGGSPSPPTSSARVRVHASMDSLSKFNEIRNQSSIWHQAIPKHGLLGLECVHKGPQSAAKPSKGI